MGCAFVARLRPFGHVVVAAAIVNALVLAAFFWSRPGATTTVRIVASGDTFRAYVDGKLHDSAKYDVDARGGIGFRLTPGKSIPSLPGPSAIRWVRVTDTDTGAILLEDSFKTGGQAGLHPEGQWIEHSGAFWSPTGGDASTHYRPWLSYVLEARFSNLVSAHVFVRVQRNGDAVDFFFRPYRDFDTGFYVKQGQAELQHTEGRTVEVSRVQTVRSILGIALRPYPTLLLVVLASILAIANATLVGRRLDFVQRIGTSVRSSAGYIAAGLALGAFGVLLAINWVFVGRMPHVPDEVAYLFQGRVFASGHLFEHVPPHVENFDFFPGMIIQDHGRWFSQYPFGHPLVLAVGEIVHAPWLVPPVVGALTVYGLYRLGAHLYGQLTGLLAVILLVASPFFQMTASNFMSHNTASLSLVAATLFLVRPGVHPRLGWFLSGLFLGLLLNIRPLTAGGMLVPFVVWLAMDVRAAANRKLLVGRAAWWVAGFGVMVAAFLLYDRVLTGSFLKTPYSYSTLTNGSLGFSGAHTLGAGLSNTETNLSLLVLVLNGWPLFVGLVFALLPFLLGTRRRSDYFLAAGVLSIIAAYMAYRGVYIMHGPRFWYETVPYLMLLSARGIHRFVETVGGIGDLLGRRAVPPQVFDARPAAALLSALLIVALVSYSVNGWTFGRHEAWTPILYVPRTMMELRNFNSTDGRLLRRASEQRVRHAVIFVRQCPGWQCYGSVFWKNSLNLDGNIVWAKDLGAESDAQLMTGYRTRRPYIADYDQATIAPLVLPTSRSSTGDGEG
jgi:hypothetical protein